MNTEFLAQRYDFESHRVSVPTHDLAVLYQTFETTKKQQPHDAYIQSTIETTLPDSTPITIDCLVCIDGTDT